jgi:cardiolipin synthase
MRVSGEPASLPLGDAGMTTSDDRQIQTKAALWLAHAVTICMLAALAGCATSLPDVSSAALNAQPGREPATVTVVPTTSDGKRVLGAAESAAVIERIEKNATSELLARHLAYVEAHVEAPLLVGNRSRLLVDGPQTHEAMFKAIAAARESIDLETYILEAGELGERLAELLTERRKRGVSVRILYDAIGSLTTPKEYFERLAAADIAICVFNPIKPTENKPQLSIHNRDHRKILVVDQRVAFTGGVNISGVYSSGSFGGSRSPSAEIGWRDTHIELEGPVVAEFSRLFDSTWEAQSCEGTPAVRRHAPPNPIGKETMRVIAQDPQTKRNEVYVEVLSAIGHAEQRAWLTFGYFVPDPQTVAALKDAAGRGVDVRLMVPSKSDVWLTLYAGRSHYTDLLESGVRIFERREAVLHAKTAVVDGVWSTVGTSNLDWRSFVHNFEVNVVILGVDSARELEALFRRDVAAADEITLQAWRSRGIGTRLKETFARIWAYYL